MNINFAQTIEPLVKKYQNRAVEVGENMHYTLHDAEIAEDIFSRSANSCTIVNINAGKHNFMAHIDPKYFNWKTFAEAFRPKVEKFQDMYGKAKAVIVGGWESGRIDPCCQTPSGEVYGTIAAVLDDMPLTMICGKKIGIKSFDHLFATQDKITVANDTFEKLGLTSHDVKNVSAEEIEKRLKKSYEWVEINSDMI